MNGLNHFRPDQLNPSSEPPDVILTRFKSSGRELHFGRPLEEVDKIELAHDVPYFSFDFAVVDYTNPKSNRYAYRLEGFDEEWIESGWKTWASYTSIEPGEYVFRVRGADHDGVWNQEGAAVRVVITPPFWQTLGFRLASGLVVLVTLVGAHRLRMLSVRRRNRLLEQQVEIRTRELQELNEHKNELLGLVAHDLRTPLGVISAWARILARRVREGTLDRERGVRDLERVRRISEELVQMASGLLDLSAIESGKLSLRLAPMALGEVLGEIHGLFLELAAEKQMDLRFELDDSLPKVRADRSRVIQVLSNLLSNALKFTPRVVWSGSTDDSPSGACRFTSKTMAPG